MAWQAEASTISGNGQGCKLFLAIIQPRVADAAHRATVRVVEMAGDATSSVDVFAKMHHRWIAIIGVDRFPTHPENGVDPSGAWRGGTLFCFHVEVLTAQILLRMATAVRLSETCS